MTEPTELYTPFANYAFAMDSRERKARNDYNIYDKVQKTFEYAVKACPTLSKLAATPYEKLGVAFVSNPERSPVKNSELDDGIRISGQAAYSKDAESIIYAITDPTRLDIDFQSHSPEQVIASIRDSVKNLGGKTSPKLEKDLKLVEDNIKQNFEALKTEQLAYRKSIFTEYSRMHDASVQKSPDLSDSVEEHLIGDELKTITDGYPLLTSLLAPSYRGALTESSFSPRVHRLMPYSGETYEPADSIQQIIGVAAGGNAYVEAPKERQTGDITIYDPMPPKQYNVELIKSVKMLGGNPDNPALKAEINKVQELYKTNWDAVEKNKVDSKKQELDELRQKLGGRGVKVSDASDLNSGANLVFAGFQKQSQALEV